MTTHRWYATEGGCYNLTSGIRQASGGLGAVSVFVFRRTRPDAPRPFRVPGYPWTPALFVLAALGIVIATLVGQPARAIAGLVALAVGMPAYLIWRRSAPVGEP